MHSSYEILKPYLTNQCTSKLVVCFYINITNYSLHSLHYKFYNFNRWCWKKHWYWYLNNLSNYMYIRKIDMQLKAITQFLANNPTQDSIKLSYFITSCIWCKIPCKRSPCSVSWPMVHLRLQWFFWQLLSFLRHYLHRDLYNVEI